MIGICKKLYNNESLAGDTTLRSLKSELLLHIRAERTSLEKNPRYEEAKGTSLIRKGKFIIGNDKKSL